MLSIMPLFDTGATPGSVKVSNTVEDGIYKSRITFGRTATDAESLEQLRILCQVRLIAIYVDEAGNTRVAGSPDYPLTLEVNESGGVITGTLTGESLFAPPFLEVS